ncbi:transposase InsO family protein [Methylobacterium sp. OAE515]
MRTVRIGSQKFKNVLYTPVHLAMLSGQGNAFLIRDGAVLWCGIVIRSDDVGYEPRACSRLQGLQLLAVTAQARPLGLRAPTLARCLAYPCRPSPALRSSAGARQRAGRGRFHQSQSGGAPHAPECFPRPGRSSIPVLHAGKRSQPSDRAKPAEAGLLARAAQHGLAGRHRLSADWSGLAPPAAVLNLAIRKIVGLSMRDHMRTELSVAALMMAAQRQRPAAGLIFHLDRGSQ